MLKPEFLTQQASHYRMLAEQLKADFADLDDDTLDLTGSFCTKRFDRN